MIEIFKIELNNKRPNPYIPTLNITKFLLKEYHKKYPGEESYLGSLKVEYTLYIQRKFHLH